MQHELHPQQLFVSCSISLFRVDRICILVFFVWFSFLPLPGTSLWKAWKERILTGGTASPLSTTTTYSWLVSSSCCCLLCCTCCGSVASTGAAPLPLCSGWRRASAPPRSLSPSESSAAWSRENESDFPEPIKWSLLGCRLVQLVLSTSWSRDVFQNWTYEKHLSLRSEPWKFKLFCLMIMSAFFLESTFFLQLYVFFYIRPTQLSNFVWNQVFHTHIKI